MFSEFENQNKLCLIDQNGTVDYYPNFLNASHSKQLLKQIMNRELFEQNQIFLFGQKIKVPRLEAYFALNGERYGYSGQDLKVQAFPDYLNALRLQIEQKTEARYNALLINLYRNGQDSNGWHADDEKSLGTNPSIASLSLGAERRFEIRKKTNGPIQKIILENGSLLHMHGAFQHHYKHQLPKMPQISGVRLNLTFRWIESSH
jgi:alkylated DNA repair dioxygenase AlkB